MKKYILSYAFVPLFCVFCSAALASEFKPLEPLQIKQAINLQNKLFEPLIWNVVAEASLILKARVDVDKDSFESASQDHGDVYLRVGIQEILKGNPNLAPLQEDIHIFRDDSSSFIPADHLRLLAGHDCFVFADLFGNVYQISPWQPLAIRLYNTDDEHFIHREVVKDEEWLESFGDYRKRYASDPLDIRISKLIKKMRKGKGARQAMYEIYSLGKEAVPTIIRHLDDFKPFSEKRIMVPIDEVKDKVWEDFAMKHFTTVVAALGYILTKIQDSPIKCGWDSNEVSRTEIQEHIDYCRISLRHWEEANP